MQAASLVLVNVSWSAAQGPFSPTAHL